MKKELCEWDPVENKPAFQWETDQGIKRFGCNNEAKFSVGVDGTWHLCEYCVKLDHFKRFKAIKKLGSKHFENRVGSYFKSIKFYCDKIQSFGDTKGFNPFKMVQKFTNQKRHPGAIEYVMSKLADGKTFDTIRTNPWAYANYVMKIKHQNFNEQDSIRIHNYLKHKTSAQLYSITKGMLKEI